MKCVRLAIGSDGGCSGLEDGFSLGLGLKDDII